MCFLGFHNWEELHDKRVCKKCGKQEYWANGLYYESGGWTSPKDTTICKDCNGKGKIFDDKYHKVTCPTCGGTGKV